MINYSNSVRILAVVSILSSSCKDNYCSIKDGQHIAVVTNTDRTPEREDTLIVSTKDCHITVIKLHGKDVTQFNFQVATDEENPVYDVEDRSGNWYRIELIQ